MSMLRLSQNPLRRPDELALGARDFYGEAAKRFRGPWILLVGGSDLASTRLRMAQSVVRFDERPSYWSHAALVLDIDPDDVLGSTGVEVALWPPSSTGPERNHVSFFKPREYASDRRFPNLAVISVREHERPEHGDARSLAERARESALRENPGRGVHAFGPWIAAWASQVFAPSGNPLLSDVPFPSTALIDYFHASSGVDLLPAAATPALCPEALWASARYYSKRHDLRVEAISRVRQPLAVVPEAAKGSAAEAYARFRSGQSKHA
jgi:hypothetical protein